MSALRYFALFFAVTLIAGESYVMANAVKPWSLAIDDYLAAAALLLFAWRTLNLGRLVGLAISWAFCVGNLWVILIYRIDPVLGSGERISLVIAALAASGIGLCWAGIHIYKQLEK